MPEKRYDLLTRLFFRFLLRRCDHVNFVSTFLRDYYSNTENIKLKNTSVIYPGSDHASVKYSEQEKQQFLSDLSIKQDAFIILAQGLTSHVLKYKGACLLLEAFAKLRFEYPHLVLIITKQGKYLDDLQRLADELKIDRFGNIYPVISMIPLLCMLLQVFMRILLLARVEFLFPFCEAMAAGNPIIATNTGGIPELLRDGKTALLTATNAAAVYFAP